MGLVFVTRVFICCLKKKKENTEDKKERKRTWLYLPASIPCVFVPNKELVHLTSPAGSYCYCCCGLFQATFLQSILYCLAGVLLCLGLSTGLWSLNPISGRHKTALSDSLSTMHHCSRSMMPLGARLGFCSYSHCSSTSCTSCSMLLFTFKTKFPQMIELCTHILL